MGNPHSTPLKRAISSLGLTTREFAAKIGLQYATFNYRIRTGGFMLQDYHAILRLTGKEWKDLFPDPLAPKPQKIELNLAHAVEQATIKKPTVVKSKEPKPVKAPAPILPTPPARVEDQKPPAPPAFNDFIVENVFENFGGLPPVPPED